MIALRKHVLINVHFGPRNVAVKQSTHRVEHAMVNSGYLQPDGPIVVIKLPPAELRCKAASAIACGLVTILSLFPGTISGARADSGEFRPPPGERQLFLDDHGIARIENLHRTMHQPEKRGAVIRSPDPQKTIQTRTAPTWDPREKHYKLWVLGIDENLWQSDDGLHWTPGPKTNMRIDMAVYDPREADGSRRFKAPLLNKGFAVSADGVEWTKLDVAPIPSSDEGNFSYDVNSGRFIHTVKRGGMHGRSVALATSRDFQSWNDLGVVFQADDRDQELGRKNIQERMADPTLHHPPYDDPKSYNVDVYNMGVFRYEGLYIGLPAMFHSTGPVPNYPNTVGFHLVQLACSRDLRHWRRLGERQTFIGPSRVHSGAYDLTQILPPSAPVVRDDELWFYYTGLKWRGTFTYIGDYPNGKYVPIPGRDHDGGAVCLAVLRRDGFVSLDADDKEGSITTKPFTPPGGELYVNVDARNGQLLAELYDEHGNVLARTKPIQGDSPRVQLEWADGKLTDVERQAVNLRFKLRNARLYSYWFAN